MIDIHVHVYKPVIKDEPEVTEYELLKQMDNLGIDKAVLLPTGVSPECSFYPLTNDEALNIAGRHPERFIPFCNFDPRCGNNSPDTDFSWILEDYKNKGVKGVGELTGNLYFDDPLYKNLYDHCGKVGLPVLFHLAEAVRYGLYGPGDELGMPRLEKMLQELPETVFIGHAMAFWAEISGDVTIDTRGGYPPGPVTEGGKLPDFLSSYPNMYADISAGSGFNAISRDPEFGYKFMEDYQDKLLFGTDICHVDQVVPIVPFINEAVESGKISRVCYEKITHLNAEKLLSL